MEPTNPAATPDAIHPATEIGLVTLRVADLARSQRFYTETLGFRVIDQNAEGASLGAQSGPPLLELRELTGAAPKSPRATGLYHVAILLPTRPDLGRFLLRIARAGIPIGQADHLVSEALYLSDPDDNGLEVYRDRPRDEWNWTNGRVAMATDPIDLDDLIAEGQRDAQPWDVLPTGTRVGHIHLQVSDIAQAEQFYHTILGFDITAKLPGALFVSAGGYHHHIGLNTWQSRGAGLAPQDVAGLHTFVIALPHPEALAAIKGRLDAHGVAFQTEPDALIITDPWGNRIRLQAGAILV